MLPSVLNLLLSTPSLSCPTFPDSEPIIFPDHLLDDFANREKQLGGGGGLLCNHLLTYFVHFGGVDLVTTDIIIVRKLNLGGGIFFLLEYGCFIGLG